MYVNFTRYYSSILPKTAQNKRARNYTARLVREARKDARKLGGLGTASVHNKNRVAEAVFLDNPQIQAVASRTIETPSKNTIKARQESSALYYGNMLSNQHGAKRDVRNAILKPGDSRRPIADLMATDDAFIRANSVIAQEAYTRSRDGSLPGYKSRLTRNTKPAPLPRGDRKPVRDYFWEQVSGYTPENYVRNSQKGNMLKYNLVETGRIAQQRAMDEGLNFMSNP